MQKMKSDNSMQTNVNKPVVEDHAISRFIVSNRYLILIFISVITVFFAFQISKVEIKTELSDLLPQKHEYVKLHKKFRHIFGGANILYIDVFVKDGDIFNTDTLKKISYFTEETKFLPGVDRYKIFSITQSKVKDIKASKFGMEIKPLIPEIPETKEELDALRQKVYTNDMVYGSLVSLDSKAALISVQFQEDIALDYPVIFNKIKEISNTIRDENTDVAIAGDPMVRGYLYSYLGQTKVIFCVTLLAMVALMFIYTRSLQMVFMPVMSGILSAVWGLGFLGILGYALDPLALVVPLLITARTLSHSVQFNERVIEEYAVHRDIRAACYSSIKALFFPGLAGIITDAAGIAVLIAIPIPFLQKLGIISSFWALSTIFTVLFFNPVVLLLLPPFIKERKSEEGIYKKIATKTAMLNSGRGSWAVLGVTLLIAVIGVFYASELKVGDVNPGTPILWSDSAYNKDARILNKSFLGLNPMLIVVEGEEKDSVYKYDILHKIEAYQRHIEKLPSAGGSISIVDVLKKLNLNLNKGNAKWSFLPHSETDIAVLHYMFFSSSDPGDLDAYCTHDNRSMSISVYFKNHEGDTLREAVNATREFEKNNPIKGAKLKFAAGTVGILAAANEEIFKTQVQLLIMSFALTIFFCALSFRSLLAGILLVIPLAVSNYLIFAYMGLKGIGLNINTLPVATIAIGIGVDYGVYFLSRMREQFNGDEDILSSIHTAMNTTGKAICFTALTVGLGVVFWLLSDIKFQAEMGLLLTMATILHILGTLILLPALVLVIKPKFLSKG
ncbi:MAG: MMPL family transporter [Desulfobacterales bacterium]|nr:MMPL family transporter [Desulfobacteraceae bacterium]MBT7086641.1 MMPL family transporter [Desulfobacterales bacterium]MBT7696847.1 MMPL family transporter [Desulfobacterales bacterium]